MEEEKLSKKINRLENENIILKSQWEKLKKDYDALAEGIYRVDHNDCALRLFKVQITFNDTDCGHVLGEVVCNSLLIAKLVEKGVQQLFANRVTVITHTKKNIHDDSNEWMYV